MKTKISLLIITIALAAPAAGRCAGTASAPFLRSETTARVSGMAGAQAALCDDNGALYFNPAGLPYAGTDRVSFTTWNGLDSKSRFAFLSGVYNTGKAGIFHLSYLNFNSGKEDVFDLGGNETSVLLEQDYAIGLGWGREVLKGVSFGAQIKSVSSKLAEDYTARAMTLDAGMLLKSADSRYTAALGLRNTGGKLKFVDEGDPLPRTVYAGVAGRYDLPAGKLLAAFDIEKPKDQDAADGRLGFEYTLSRFALRAGIKRVDNATSFTAGGGVKLSWLGLDYGFEPAGNLNEPVHKFTINVSFGGPAKTDKAQAAQPAQAPAAPL